jgi:rubrerythrin
VPDLGKNPDDQTVLQYALMREQAAMEQYTALAESTPSGPIQDLFQFLANEETKHKNELEAIYYEVVHSGGV